MLTYLIESVISLKAASDSKINSFLVIFVNYFFFCFLLSIFLSAFKAHLAAVHFAIL